MNRVRVIRKQQRRTLQDISEEVGVSIPFLSDVELGRRGAKPETWGRIAAALGVTVADLKGEEVDNGATSDRGGDG